MPRAFNRTKLYLYAIWSSVVLWHLMWLIQFGSPISVFRRILHIVGSLDGPNGLNNLWLLVFGGLPFLILFVVLFFATDERIFRKEHPLAFWSVIAAALSPSLCVTVAFLLVVS